jgi:hypothetical protein
MKQLLNSIKIADDTAEKAIGFMTKHNTDPRTKSEEVLQENLQVLSIFFSFESQIKISNFS